MYKSIFTLLALVCSQAVLPAQKNNHEFEQFAQRQDSLFIVAYEERNTGRYDKLLNEFFTQYNPLNDTEKKLYANYLINAYYNFSCTYSLLNDKKMALLYLEKSIQAGYLDYAHIQADTDLDNIRGEGKFAALLEPLREIGDYRYILRKAQQYNPADKRPIPAFTYQPASDPNLVALRKAFNLDSIAGQGSEVSKIINLCHWIHYLVPHDGNNGNPVVKNALSMINECKRENRKLNCRGLAIVLNECYLSMGFKSRFVTCLPKDSLGIDNDCHVINMVYSNDLKKWLWIDPTFDAYVMNENGELLGLDEVRDRIIRDKPLILNPEANWNRRVSQTREHYLQTYMAKNLYRLECPVHSQYDMETKAQGKTIDYVQLLPLDYFKQTPDKTEQSNEQSGTTLTTYKTNNPELFWAKPE